MELICDLLAVEIVFMRCLHPCKNSQMGGRRMDFGVREPEFGSIIIDVQAEKHEKKSK